MNEPTRVHGARPERRFGALGVALAAAAGFLAGVLLVAALGGAKPATRASTVTVTTPASSTGGGTVITKTAVPDVVGERLDVAVERLARAGFEVDVEGGGLFGVIDEENWQVVAQDPAADSGLLEQGSTVTVEIDRL